MGDMNIREAKKSLYKDLGKIYTEVIGAGIKGESIKIYLSSEPTPSKSGLVDKYQGFDVVYEVIGEIKIQ
jgi:hypothetical protein